ncbi:MAG: TolC family protein [Myxococcota bacterium]
MEVSLKPISEQDDGDVSFDGTLAAYTAYAYARSPALRASFETWRAATHRPEQERRMPEPTVSYTAFVRAVETRVGPQRHRLSASQRFPWPTTLRAGGEAATLEAVAAQRRFESHALRIAAEIAEAYWLLWRIERELQVHQGEIEVLQSLSEQVRGRVAVGVAELSDLAQLDLQLSRARDRHASLGRRKRAASAGLVRILGAPDRTPTPVASIEPEAAPPAESIDRLAASAGEHPNVRAFVSLSDAARQRERKARAERAPSFGIGVDWILTGETAASPALADTGKDAVAVSLSLQVPLWTRVYRAAQSQASAEAAAHRSRAIDARNGVLAEVRQHAELLEDASRRVAFYDNTLIPQGTTAFESVLASYATGRSTVAELLLAERALISLRSERLVALADYGVELARLERAVGRPVELTPATDGQDAP